MTSLCKALLDIPVLFSLKKISRVLNLLATGFSHEKCGIKKIVPEKKKKIIHRSKYYKKITYAEKSIHAEEMAISKIKRNPKKMINVSLMVIRISYNSTIETYHLANSKPCVSCMYKIKNTVNIGYHINKIYFSDENGNIICYKIRDLLKEKHHLSKYYRASYIPKRLIKEFNIAKI